MCKHFVIIAMTISVGLGLVAFGGPHSSGTSLAQALETQPPLSQCFRGGNPVVEPAPLLSPPVHWNMSFSNGCDYSVDVYVSVTIYEDGRRVAWGRGQNRYGPADLDPFTFLCHQAIGCGKDLIVDAAFSGQLTIQETWNACRSGDRCGYPPYPTLQPTGPSTSTSGPECFRGGNPVVESAPLLSPPVHWNMSFSNGCDYSVDVYVSVTIYEDGRRVAWGRGQNRYGPADLDPFTFLCHQAIGCGKDLIVDAAFSGQLTIQETWNACRSGDRCGYPPYPRSQ